MIKDDLERLHAEYGTRVFAWFRRKGFSIEESEDLRQDVFLRAGRKLKPGIENEKGWLYSVVQTVWKNELRYRQAGKREGVEISLSDGADDPATRVTTADRIGEAGGPDALERLLREERSLFFGALLSHLREERRKFVREAAADLPERMRACVQLYFEDRPYREIAAQMGISEQTVKTQMHHARTRLKETLADQAVS